MGRGSSDLTLQGRVGRGRGRSVEPDALRRERVGMEPAFEIKIRHRDQTLIIEVAGELDVATAPLLEKKLAEAEAAGATSLLVDLEQCEFIDSSGLHVLLAHVIRNGSAQRYAVTRGSRQVQRLFEVAGVIDRLPFAESDNGSGPGK
jgi:anti-sigma B factor antagonist